MRYTSTIGMAFSIIFFGAGTVAAAGCASNLKLEQGAVGKIIQCLKEIEAENTTLRQQVADLTVKSEVPGPKGVKGDPGEKGEPGLGAQIPFGALVAFDGGEYEKSPQGRLNSGCPRGWVRFEQAAGRFILGSDSYPGFDNGSTPKYKLRNEGGEEAVRFTNPNQIPAHSHSASIGANHRVLQNKDIQNDHARPNINGSDRFMEVSGTAIGVTVGATGGNQPHNNMPPFITLYYCKKV